MATDRAVAGRPEPVEQGPLNVMLMTGTSVIHRDAERRPFMVAFFKGELSKKAYGEYLGRLYQVYEALEDVAEQLRDDPVVGRMYSPELFRREGLDRDLRFYAGDDWRATIAPSAAAKDYAERIREVAREFPAGYVAHHWLRYLGYVLGQDLLKKLTNKSYGVTDEGVSFYEFPQIDDPKSYLREYHARMNAMPLSDEEKLRVVEEGFRAFSLNIGLTDELAADFGVGIVTEDETTKIVDQLKAEHP